MLELLKDISSNAVGVKATGNIRKEDYKNVLLPALKELYVRNGKVSLLLLIETQLKNYSLGAWIEDAKTGLRYFSKWHRVAIVSAHKGIKTFTDTFGLLVPGQYKGFMKEDLAKAKDWISS
jgi:SpoIIAA-like